MRISSYLVICLVLQFGNGNYHHKSKTYPGKHGISRVDGISHKTSEHAHLVTKLKPIHHAKELSHGKLHFKTALKPVHTESRHGRRQQVLTRRKRQAKSGGSKNPVCTKSGQFAHPNGCDKYFKCTKAGKRFKMFQFECESGSLFQESVEKCLPATPEELIWKCKIPPTSAPIVTTEKPITTTTLPAAVVTVKKRTTTMAPVTTTKIPTTMAPVVTTKIPTTMAPVTTTVKPSTRPPILTHVKKTVAGTADVVEVNKEQLKSKALHNVVCTTAGMFAHPAGCHKYYRCVKAGKRFKIFYFDCGDDTVFDETAAACVPRNSLPPNWSCRTGPGSPVEVEVTTTAEPEPEAIHEPEPVVVAVHEHESEAVSVHEHESESDHEDEDDEDETKPGRTRRVPKTETGKKTTTKTTVRKSSSSSSLPVGTPVRGEDSGEPIVTTSHAGSKKITKTSKTSSSSSSGGHGGATVTRKVTVKKTSTADDGDEYEESDEDSDASMTKTKTSRKVVKSSSSSSSGGGSSSGAQGSLSKTTIRKKVTSTVASEEYEDSAEAEPETTTSTKTSKTGGVTKTTKKIIRKKVSSSGSGGSDDEGDEDFGEGSHTSRTKTIKKSSKTTSTGDEDEEYEDEDGDDSMTKTKTARKKTTTTSGSEEGAGGGAELAGKISEASKTAHTKAGADAKNYILPHSICTGDGVFVHPNSCAKYYRCHKAGKRFQLFQFDCEPDTVFDGTVSTCVSQAEVNPAFSCTSTPLGSTSKTHKTTVRKSKTGVGESVEDVDVEDEIVDGKKIHRETSKVVHVEGGEGEGGSKKTKIIRKTTSSSSSTTGGGDEEYEESGEGGGMTKTKTKTTKKTSSSSHTTGGEEEEESGEGGGSMSKTRTKTKTIKKSSSSSHTTGGEGEEEYEDSGEGDGITKTKTSRKVVKTTKTATTEGESEEDFGGSLDKTHSARKGSSKSDVLSSSICTKNGEFPHPSGCHKHYKCTKVGKRFRLFQFDCDTDTFFDETLGRCESKAVLGATWTCKTGDGGADHETDSESAAGEGHAKGSKTVTHSSTTKTAMSGIQDSDEEEESGESSITKVKSSRKTTTKTTAGGGSEAEHEESGGGGSSSSSKTKKVVRTKTKKITSEGFEYEDYSDEDGEGSGEGMTKTKSARKKVVTTGEGQNQTTKSSKTVVKTTTTGTESEYDYSLEVDGEAGEGGFTKTKTSRKRVKSEGSDESGGSKTSRKTISKTVTEEGSWEYEDVDDGAGGKKKVRKAKNSTTRSTSKKEDSDILPHSICTEDGVFVHPKHCDKYYRCSKKPHKGFQLFQFDCESGTIFDDTSKTCVESSLKDTDMACKAKKISEKITDSLARHKDPDSFILPHTICTKDGAFAHPRTCSKHYTCKKTGKRFRLFQFDCDEGEVFDETLKDCVKTSSLKSDWICKTTGKGLKEQIDDAKAHAEAESKKEGKPAISEDVDEDDEVTHSKNSTQVVVHKTTTSNGKFVSSETEDGIIMDDDEEENAKRNRTKSGDGGEDGATSKKQTRKKIKKTRKVTKTTTGGEEYFVDESYEDYDDDDEMDKVKSAKKTKEIEHESEESVGEGGFQHSTATTAIPAQKIEDGAEDEDEPSITPVHSKPGHKKETSTSTSKTTETSEDEEIKSRKKRPDELTESDLTSSEEIGSDGIKRKKSSKTKTTTSQTSTTVEEEEEEDEDGLKKNFSKSPKKTKENETTESSKNDTAGSETKTTAAVVESESEESFGPGSFQTDSSTTPETIPEAPPANLKTSDKISDDDNADRLPVLTTTPASLPVEDDDYDDGDDPMKPVHSAPKKHTAPGLPPGVECSDEGDFDLPDDCSKFYRCTKSGDKFDGTMHDCDKGQVFDEFQSVCSTIEDITKLSKCADKASELNKSTSKKERSSEDSTSTDSSSSSTNTKSSKNVHYSKSTKGGTKTTSTKTTTKTTHETTEDEEEVDSLEQRYYEKLREKGIDVDPAKGHTKTKDGKKTSTKTVTTSQTHEEIEEDGSDSKETKKTTEESDHVTLTTTKAKSQVEPELSDHEVANILRWYCSGGLDLVKDKHPTPLTDPIQNN